MKISTFSKETGMTVDTIRYYIELGVLAPRKVNTKFSFDKEDLLIAKNITFLKKCGFELAEMKLFLFLKNIQPDIKFSEMPGFKEKLTKSKEEIQKKIDNEIQNIKLIDETLNEPKSPTNPNRGVPINELSIFEINGETFSLNAKKVVNNEIIDGVLKARGKTLKIVDGIVFDDYSDKVFTVKEKSQFLISYYKASPKSSIQSVNDFRKSLIDIFAIEAKDKKYILINNADGCSFLPSLLENLKDVTVILVGDEGLVPLKSIYTFNKNINYIFYIKQDNIPLIRPHKVDLLIDNFSFDATFALFKEKHFDFYTDLLSEKDDAKVLLNKIFINNKKVVGKDEFEQTSAKTYDIDCLFNSERFVKAVNDFPFLSQDRCDTEICIYEIKRRHTQR